MSAGSMDTLVYYIEN